MMMVTFISMMMITAAQGTCDHEEDDNRDDFDRDDDHQELVNIWFENHFLFLRLCILSKFIGTPGAQRFKLQNIPISKQN